MQRADRNSYDSYLDPSSAPKPAAAFAAISFAIGRQLLRCNPAEIRTAMSFNAIIDRSGIAAAFVNDDAVTIERTSAVRVCKSANPKLSSKERVKF